MTVKEATCLAGVGKPKFGLYLLRLFLQILCQVGQVF